MHPHTPTLAMDKALCRPLEEAAIRTHLWKERRNHGACDFLLSFQLHQHHNRPATMRQKKDNTSVLWQQGPWGRDWSSGSPADAVLVHHFVRQLNIRVAVTEAGHIRHLAVRQLQQCVPLLILHLHDIENTLHSLQQAFSGQWERTQ